jgi:hypothetical protein
VTVQCHTDVDERSVALLERRLVLRRDPHTGRLGPGHRVDVAEPSLTFLQVGFQQEGHLARGLVTVDHTPVQLSQPGRAVLPPRLARLAGERVGQTGITGDQTGRQQRGGRIEVGRGEIERLGHAAHRVPELETRVPHRVPHPTGELVDHLVTVMEDHDVEIAERRQLAAAIAADGDDGHRLLGSLSGERSVGDLGQPLVGPVRQRSAQDGSAHGLIGDQGGAGCE